MPGMTAEPPLVSVLIPTYNRPDLLKEAIASAVQQTLGDTEILVQDDGSDLNPEQVVAEFGDPRISFRRNESNLGMALNWKALALRARGKYLAFLSDDDVWDREYLSILAGKLEEKPDRVVAFCDHWATDAAGVVDPLRSAAASQRWMRDRIAEGEHKPFAEIALIYRSIWTASAAVFRREAIDWNAVPAEAGVVVDLYLAYLAARTGGAAWYCRERLVSSRDHERSTSAGFAALEARLGAARDSIFCWRAFAEDRNLRSISPYFRIKLVQNLFKDGMYRWRQGNPNARLLAIFRLLSPGLCAWNLKYMIRLRRIRI
jgi:glycosyltransferase involved in cell wall biosynthesis